MPIIFDLLTGHNQKSFDGVALAQMAHEAGFDGVCRHLMTPWDSTLMPWVRLPNGDYDLTQIDPNWERKELITKMALAERGLWIVDKYFDDYCRINPWRKYRGYPVKAHPFVENNAGINWGGDSRPIFNNWKKTGKQPDDFHWMWWKKFDPPDSENLVEYEFHNKIGKGIKLYLETSFKIDALVLEKHKKKAKFLKSFWNEARAEYDSNGKIVYMKDVDHRNLQAMVDMTKKFGIAKPRFRIAVDFEHRNPDESIHWANQIKGYKTFLRPNKYMQEMHSMGTLQQIQECYDKGFAPNHFYPSSDGSPEKDVNDFYKRHQAIIKGIPSNGWFGAKMRVYPNWKPRNTNENLEKNFKEYAKGVFGA